MPATTIVTTRPHCCSSPNEETATDTAPDNSCISKRCLKVENINLQYGKHHVSEIHPSSLPPRRKIRNLAVGGLDSPSLGYSMPLLSRVL